MKISRKNNRTISISYLLGYGLLLVLFSAQAARAQDWRLSASYSVQSVGIDYTPNPNYQGQVGTIAKGMAEVELEKYLLHRLYVAGKGELLVHDRADFVLGGPINFKQFNLGGTIGLQWPKFGVYAGAKAGGMWDFRIRSTHRITGQVSWVEPMEDSGKLTGSLIGGIKYYLLNFIRLQAEIAQTTNLPVNVTPQHSFTENPAVRSFDVNPISFSVGISIGIPWNRPAKRSPKERKLPPLMRLSGVKFDVPMKSTFVTSKFGPRWNKTHQGVDLNAKLRDKIVAAESGVVIKAGQGRGFGKMVRIKHAKGFETVYAHMSRIKVREGDHVKKGQIVGKAGNTGTATGVHLHFEIWKNGKPIDPESVIRF